MIALSSSWRSNGTMRPASSRTWVSSGPSPALNACPADSGRMQLAAPHTEHTGRNPSGLLARGPAKLVVCWPMLIHARIDRRSRHR